MNVPQLQAEEVDAALAKAKELGWYRHPDPPGVPSDAISSIEMYEVLQVAFGAESTRLNGELRAEAQWLKQKVRHQRDELQEFETQRNELRAEIGQIRRVGQLVESTRRFIQLASDTSAVQMARAFQDMETLLTTLEKYGEE